MDAVTTWRRVSFCAAGELELSHVAPVTNALLTIATMKNLLLAVALLGTPYVNLSLHLKKGLRQGTLAPNFALFR